MFDFNTLTSFGIKKTPTITQKLNKNKNKQKNQKCSVRKKYLKYLIRPSIYKYYGIKYARFYGNLCKI